MTMNIGGGYPMMGNNMAMMGGMSGMGNMSGASGSENLPQSYMMRYGCENCFRKQPYWDEYPKPITPEPKGALQPSFIRRFINNIIGG